MIIFEHTAPLRLLPRLDPRVRVAFVAVFSVGICLCEEWTSILTGLLAGALLLCIAGLTPRQAAQRLIPLNAFMSLLVLTMPLVVPGPSVLHIANLSWSLNGVMQTLHIAARANAVMMMLTALLGTLEAPHLGFALDGLGVPTKFTHLLLFMVRYTEIIHHEYHHLRDAMRLRGFRPRSNRHTLRTFAYLIGQLLVRSLNRSERILAAMKCRGFQGRFYVLETSRLGRGDIAFATIGLVFLAALLTLEMTCRIP